MVERIEELNLPNAVVTRLMKEALPADAKISNESRVSLSRATSVFVLYVTAAATMAAQEKNQKSLTTEHIFSALEEIDFESFVKPLKADLEIYRKLMKSKKTKKMKATVVNRDEAASSELVHDSEAVGNGETIEIFDSVDDSEAEVNGDKVENNESLDDSETVVNGKSAVNGESVVSDAINDIIILDD